MEKKEEQKCGIMTAKDLACYIKRRYNESTYKDITPIKMQKSLYFCFAFWAGFVNKGILDGTLDKTENDRLFDDTFEAWSYGPVVPTVYFDEKRMTFFSKKKDEDAALKRVEDIFSKNTFLSETINSLLDDIFEISDFKLVSLSHADKSWQNHFHSDDEKHNESIPFEEIICEYTTKKLA